MITLCFTLWSFSTGMTEEESAPLLEYLCGLSSRPELQCRVRWEPGTLTVWDNRCTQHMAIRDNTEHRRVMRRVEIRGDEPIPPRTASL
jgi:taurine dioxygenase